MHLKFLKCLMLLGFCSYVVIWRHPADQVNIDVVATQGREWSKQAEGAPSGGLNGKASSFASNSLSSPFLCQQADRPLRSYQEKTDLLSLIIIFQMLSSTHKMKTFPSCTVSIPCLLFRNNVRAQFLVATPQGPSLSLPLPSQSGKTERAH